MQQLLPLPEIKSRTGAMYPPSRSQRIYCNRNLRMDSIEAVGFDMDYTLAIYRQEEMDRLAIEVTLQKLVARGYPDYLLETTCRTDFPVRGLLIDRKLGNVLKMDRYRYVKTAYHGLRQLDRDERRRAYHARRLRPGTERYHWVDTLYGLSEVAVYAGAIDAIEARGERVDYSRFFTDVRECMDLSHQDDSILGVVYADLPHFVERDPLLGVALHRLRSSGKRLFLLTNSGPAYTERMMTYLFDKALPEYPSWRHYFDYVITAAKKPGFFTRKDPFLLDGKEVARLERSKIYTGGNMHTLQRTLEVGGDQVLYIGDHIFGDVLRAKKDSAWRTAMIIQEMREELLLQDALNADFERSDSLREARVALQDELRENQSRLKAVERRLVTERNPDLEADRVRHRHLIDRLRAQLRSIEEERQTLSERIDKRFHPFWGSLFKAGSETSSFGDQVEQYACLYTAFVSNFLLYSPMHYFEGPRDRMPHEL